MHWMMDFLPYSQGQWGGYEETEYDKLARRLQTLPKALFSSTTVRRWTPLNWRVKLVNLGIYFKDGEMVDVFVGSNGRLYDYDEYAKGRRRFRPIFFLWSRPDAQHGRLLQLLEGDIRRLG